MSTSPFLTPCNTPLHPPSHYVTPKSTLPFTIQTFSCLKHATFYAILFQVEGGSLWVFLLFSIPTLRHNTLPNANFNTLTEQVPQKPPKHPTETTTTITNTMPITTHHNQNNNYYHQNTHLFTTPTTLQNSPFQQLSTNHHTNHHHNSYPPSHYPVIALRGAPAPFPMRPELWPLQQHLVLSQGVQQLGDRYIDHHFPHTTFIGIHLRNGEDWVR